MKCYVEKTQSNLYEYSQQLLAQIKKENANKIMLEEIHKKKCYSDTEVDELIGRTSLLTVATRAPSLNGSFTLDEDLENDEFKDILIGNQIELIMQLEELQIK